MGGVADTVSGWVGTDGGGGGLLGEIENVTAPTIKSIGNMAEGAVHAVGSAAESVGHTLQSIGQAAVNNPIGTIAKIAAAASGQWYLLPIVSALDVVAHGGNIEQAALAAGVSLATSYIGGNVSAYMNTPGLDSVASMATQDAVELAAQDISADQISQILQQSYDLAPNIADSMANAAGSGISSSTLASAYAGAFGQQLTGVQDAFSEKLLSTAIGNSAANFAKTLVQTKGDVGKALTMGAAAGIGTELSGQISNQLVQAGSNETLANITGKIAGATAAGVVQGQDVGKALGTSLVSNIISISYAQAGSALKTAADQSGITKIFTDMGTAAAGKMNEFANSFKTEQTKVNDLAAQQSSLVNDYNTKLSTASDYYQNTLTPAQIEAQRLQDAAKTSFDSYSSTRDQFSNLVSQYDAAKAAGNTDLANSLADQANALIPTLNAATDKYNTDATIYETAAQKFTDVAATYKSQTDTLSTLKTQYTDIGNKITATTAECNKYADAFNTTAATVQQDVQNVIDQKKSSDEQLADAPAAVQKAFQNAFSTGMMPDKALETANNVAKLSGVSQDAFNQSFATGQSVDQALKFAQDVNTMPTKQQNYYDFATGLGLKPADALSVAPQLASASTPALQSFFDTYSTTGSTTASAKVATDIDSLSAQQRTAFVNGRDNGLDISQSLAMAKSVGTLSAAQQSIYLDAVKTGGLTDPYASMYAKSAGIYTPDKTAVVDVNANNLAKLTTQEGKDAYNMTIAKTDDPVQALNAAKVIENAIALATGSGNAQAGELPTTGEKYTTQGVWQQRGDGAWSIVGKDQQGRPITLAEIAQSTSPVKEGQVQGEYVITPDINAKGGFNAAAANAGQLESDPNVASKEVSADGKTTTFTLKDGSKEVYDSTTGNLVSSSAASGTPALTSDQLLQNYMDQLLNPVKATGATGPTSTVTGPTSTVTGPSESTVTGPTSTVTGPTSAVTGPTESTVTGPTTTVTGATGPTQSELTTAYANAALQKAIATGDKTIVDAVNSGNSQVIDALNANNTSLASSIAAGTSSTTNAVNQVGSNLSNQIGAGTEATTKAIGDSTTALNYAITTGDSNIINAVKSGNGDVIGAINSGNSNLAKTIADTAAATQTSIGAVGSAIASQTAAQQAAAASQAAGVQRQNAANYMQYGNMAGTATDYTGGIKNLAPGLTKASQDYTLAGTPTIQETMSPTFQTPQFAAGGSTDSYDPFVSGSSGDSVSTGISGALKPGLTKAQIAYILSGLPGNLVEHKAEGGEIESHNPQFFSEGGLGSIQNRYVKGEGDGTSDSVPAMLANGEFVIPADVVAKLGNGSNEAGAGVLDQFLKSIRTHAQGNGDKLPPDSKGPLAYLLDAKRKVKA